MIAQLSKSRRKIMLIDDSDQFRKSAAKALAFIKIPIVTFSSGEDAFDELQKNPSSYALAFVDLEYPKGWNGIETIKRLRTISQLDVAILSAHISEQFWQDSVEEIHDIIGKRLFEKPIPLKTSPDFVPIISFIEQSINKYENAMQSVNKSNIESTSSDVVIDELKLSDILSMSYDDFLGLEEDVMIGCFERINIDMDDTIKMYFRNNPDEGWVIFGGSEFSVIAHGPSGEELSEEAIDTLAEEYNMPVFTYVRSSFIEEITESERIEKIEREENTIWSKREVLDFYPALSFKLGENMYVCEFDTGSSVSFFSLEEIIKANPGARPPVWMIFPKNTQEENERHEDVLWEIKYRFYNKFIEVEFTPTKKSKILVRAIKDWFNTKTNPITNHYAHRIGLLGRDVLIKLNMVIILDGKSKTTNIIEVNV